MANQIRGWVNNNSALVTAIAFVALIVAAVVIFRTNRGPRGLQDVGMWYVDLNTNTLFAAEGTEIPPIDAPSGELLEDGEAAGVVAHVFCCSEDPEEKVCPNCADLEAKTSEQLEEMDLFVGYYEKLVPETKDFLEEQAKKHGRQPYYGNLPGGRLVRLPDDEEWYDAMTPFGMEIEQSGSRRCGDPRKVRFCRPGM